MITVREAISPDWTNLLGIGRIALGGDQATTEKRVSNPSALAVMEHVPPLYVLRLVVRWKTADPDVSIAVWETIVDDIIRSGRRPTRGNIDGSNEIFFAKQLQKKLRGKLPLGIVKAGEALDWKGGRYTYKTLLGNLYTSAYEDNLIAAPDEQWFADDHRLVKRERGSFETDTAEDGSHGDTFSAGELALWGLERSRGPFTVEAAGVGGSAKPERRNDDPIGKPVGPLGRFVEIAVELFS